MLSSLVRKYFAQSLIGLALFFAITTRRSGRSRYVPAYGRGWKPTIATYTPVSVEIAVDPALQDATWATLTNTGHTLPGQVTAPSLLATPADTSGGRIAAGIAFRSSRFESRPN